MARDYALIKHGTVVNTIAADEDFVDTIRAEWDHIEPLRDGAGPGWGWADGAFVLPDSGGAEQPRRVSVLAFRRRFTNAERAAIEWAAVDRADQTELHRQQAAALRASLADQAAATFIDLDDDDTVAGVQMLEALGLLGAGRAAEITGAPVQPAERP